MEIRIEADAKAVGIAAARLFQPFIKIGATLGLATGSSPLETYRELIRQYENGELSFRHCRAFLLDEYVGIDPSDDNSYFKTIRNEFTAQVDFVDENVFSPDSTNPDPLVAAARYEQQISAIGIDIQLLGIGANGHIGFNEPTSSLAGSTKVQALHPRTIQDNARFFSSIAEVPTHAITQGLGTISQAGKIVLVATGEQKADAIRGIVEGPVMAMCPGSVLQLHPDVTVIVDEAAAGKLQLKEHYLKTN